MKFNSQRDLILEESKEDRPNKNADAVIAIIHYSRNYSTNLVINDFQEDTYIVLISAYIIEGSIQFFHLIQEVSGGMGSNSKFKAVLQSWGAEV